MRESHLVTADEQSIFQCPRTLYFNNHINVLLCSLACMCLKLKVTKLHPGLYLISQLYCHAKCERMVQLIEVQAVFCAIYMVHVDIVITMNLGYIVQP